MMTLIEHRCLDTDEQPVLSLDEDFICTQSILELNPGGISGAFRDMSTNIAASNAAESDANWFVQNLIEPCRVRPYLRGEFGRPKRDEQYLPVVFVVRVGLGQRIRVGHSYVVSEPDAGECS